MNRTIIIIMLLRLLFSYLDRKRNVSMKMVTIYDENGACECFFFSFSFRVLFIQGGTCSSCWCYPVPLLLATVPNAMIHFFFFFFCACFSFLCHSHSGSALPYLTQFPYTHYMAHSNSAPINFFQGIKILHIKLRFVFRRIFIPSSSSCCCSSFSSLRGTWVA